MALPDHVRAKFNFTLEQCVASFSLFYTLQAGSITQANVAQVADGIKSHYAATIAAVLPDAAFLSSVEVRSTLGFTEAEGRSTDLSTSGTVATDSLPEHDAVCIRRKTGLAGRRNRGRIFFPFVPEEFSESDGTLTGPAIVAYKAFATKLDADVVLGGTGVTLKHVQPVPSQNQLLTVTHTEIVEQIVTRRDRQRERVRNVLPVS